MLKFLKDNPAVTVLLVVSVALVLINVFQGDKENFSTCYVTRKVYLKDVSGGMSEGQLTMELNRGRLYLSFQGNLPYHKGGVYNHVNGDYHTYLVNTDDPKASVIYVGALLRYGDRIYRLKNELLGDYSAYTHFIVTRKTQNYKDKVILSGKL